MNATLAAEPVFSMTMTESGPASRGTQADEVVIGLSPGFGTTFSKTIIDTPLAQVLREVLAGIEEQGRSARVVRMRNTSDLARIARAERR